MPSRRADRRHALVASLLLVVTLPFGAAACSNQASCRRRCETRFGASQERCVELCTSSCDELRTKYGITPEACHMLHEGP